MRGKKLIALHLKKVYGFLLCIIFFLSATFGQDIVTTAGIDGSGSGGSVSSTFGQVFFTTSSGTSGSVAQGVQQPYEISVLTGFKESIGINLIFTVYPNPTADNLILKIGNFNRETFFYSIYNLKGKCLVSRKMENSETNISMKDFSSAVYILKVQLMDKTKKPKEIKTFKIVKY